MTTVKENISLQSFNTFGVEVQAQCFAAVRSEEELRTLLSRHTAAVRILGGGSNILFTKDLKVLVIKNEIYGKELISEAERHALVRVGGGENWHEFVRWCLDNDLGGVENLSLIPGTTGAAPIQNIGAYGVELQDVFDHLEAVDLETGALKTFNRDDCGFGYRDSVFKNTLKGRYFISQVFLRLTRSPHHELNTTYGAIRQTLQDMDIAEPGIRDISAAVVRIRRSKLPDPEETGNAGSFFKNPLIPVEQLETLRKKFPDIPNYPVGEQLVKVPAGWLIERLGWKGRRVGNVGCYHKQALVLVNYGGATGEEIYTLARRIADSVESTFGIRLETEVNVW